MVVTGGMAAQHNQTNQADHHGCRYDVLVQQRGGKTNTRQHHQAYSATAKPITAANSSKIVPTRED